MKIGQPSDKPVIPVPLAPVRAEQGAGAAPAPAKKTGSAGVAVTVSSRARALEKSGETADIDMEKVESVRSAIEQGTYVVNPEVIADKMLANAKEMLNRTHN